MKSSGPRVRKPRDETLQKFANVMNKCTREPYLEGKGWVRRARISQRYEKDYEPGTSTLNEAWIYLHGTTHILSWGHVDFILHASKCAVDFTHHA